MAVLGNTRDLQRRPLDYGIFKRLQNNWLRQNVELNIYFRQIPGYIRKSQPCEYLAFFWRKLKYKLSFTNANSLLHCRIGMSSIM
ncbi:hypothetical protein [Delftia sp. UME58]|uniref:hypothetical protein n=1 Tax=Delftia sp. UME58 TaxID=1862322 RepID=UPI0015FECCAE|nr:hypothetical protein [Delftia sp. UME58]MBB1650338.1 hypothetical protein [Delftia sp. UME58]